MKQIAHISIQRMTNGAHYTFGSNILKRAAENEAVAKQFAAEVAELRNALAEEKKAQGISWKSLTTDEIAQADTERDRLYRGYKRAVWGFTAVRDEGMANAARELMQHITDFRINTRSQLDQQTGLLVKFIDDLETRLAPMVEKLRLTQFVAELKEVNERLKTLTLQRTEERMALPVGAMRKARAATNAAYHRLATKVNATAIVLGEADFADFIDYVNTEIVHYKREVLNKKAAADKAQPTADADGTTDEQGEKKCE